MNLIELFKGISFFLLAHSFTILQLNGQFKWAWFRENEWVLALFGIPISFFYIWGTKYTVRGFEGLLWPTKFIGFGVGIILYSIFIGKYFNEDMGLKTVVSLLLSVTLIGIQILWKN